MHVIAKSHLTEECAEGLHYPGLDGCFSADSDRLAIMVQANRFVAIDAASMPFFPGAATSDDAYR